MSALPLTVLNVSAALGRILVGFAADKLGPVNALWVAITLSGLTQLLVWTFVETYAGIVRVFSSLCMPLVHFSFLSWFWVSNHPLLIYSYLLILRLTPLTSFATLVLTDIPVSGTQMVFAILYGFFCGCFLSLISAVAAKLYGADRLAGLSGLLLLFNAPGTSLKFALAALVPFPFTLLPSSHIFSHPICVYVHVRILFSLAMHCH